MSIFLPDYRFERLWDIPMSFFTEKKIKCILLDVDNTMTTHGHPEPHQKVPLWLDEVRRAGIRPVIISNNKLERVSPFADKLSLEFISKASKPRKKGIKSAITLTDAKKNEMMLIGDQIFTDVLCGKISGIKTVLLTPIEPESGSFFRVKRYFEKRILKGSGAHERSVRSGRQR